MQASSSGRQVVAAGCSTAAHGGWRNSPHHYAHTRRSAQHHGRSSTTCQTARGAAAHALAQQHAQPTPVHAAAAARSPASCGLVNHVRGRQEAPLQHEREAGAGPLPELHTALRDLSTWARTGERSALLPRYLASVAAHADSLVLEDILFLLDISPALQRQALRTRTGGHVRGGAGATSARLFLFPASEAARASTPVGGARGVSQGKAPGQVRRVSRAQVRALTPLSLAWWSVVLGPPLMRLGLSGNIALLEYCVERGLEPTPHARQAHEHVLLQLLTSAGQAPDGATQGPASMQAAQPPAQHLGRGLQQPHRRQRQGAAGRTDWLLRLLIVLSRARHSWRPHRAVNAALLSALQPGLRSMSSRQLAVCCKALALMQVTPPLPWQVDCIAACLNSLEGERATDPAVPKSGGSCRPASTGGGDARSSATAAGARTSGSAGSASSRTGFDVSSRTAPGGFDRDGAGAVLQALAMFESSPLGVHSTRAVTWRHVRARSRLTRRLLHHGMSHPHWRAALILGLPGNGRLKRAVSATSSATMATNCGSSRNKGNTSNAKASSSVLNVGAASLVCAAQAGKPAGAVGTSQAQQSVGRDGGSSCETASSGMGSSTGTGASAGPAAGADATPRAMAIRAPAHFRARRLRYSLWAVARFRLPASRLYLRALLAPRNVPHLPPGSLVHAFTILASRRWIPSKHLSSALWHQATRMWQYFDVPCMADMLWAAARAGQDAPDTEMVQAALRAAAAAAGLRLKATGGRHASGAGDSRMDGSTGGPGVPDEAHPTPLPRSSSSSSSGSNSSVVASVGDFAAQSSTSTKPSQAHGAVRSGLLFGAQWKLANMQPTHLARLVWAAARMGVAPKDPDVAVLLQRAVAAWMQFMTPEEAAAALWALARQQQVTQQQQQHAREQEQAATAQMESGLCVTKALSDTLSIAVPHFARAGPSAAQQLSQCAWAAAVLRLPLSIGTWVSLLPSADTPPSQLSPDAAAQVLFATAHGLVGRKTVAAAAERNSQAPASVMRASGALSASNADSDSSSSSGSTASRTASAAPPHQALSKRLDRLVLQQRLLPALRRLFVSTRTPSQHPSGSAEPYASSAIPAGSSRHVNTAAAMSAATACEERTAAGRYMTSTASGFELGLLALDSETLVGAMWSLAHLGLVPEPSMTVARPSPPNQHGQGQGAQDQARVQGQGQGRDVHPAHTAVAGAGPSPHQAGLQSHWLSAACQLLGMRLRTLPAASQLRLAVALCKMRAHDCSRVRQGHSEAAGRSSKAGTPTADIVSAANAQSQILAGGQGTALYWPGSWHVPVSGGQVVPPVGEPWAEPAAGFVTGLRSAAGHAFDGLAPSSAASAASAPAPAPAPVLTPGSAVVTTAAGWLRGAAGEALPATSLQRPVRPSATMSAASTPTITAPPTYAASASTTHPHPATTSPQMPSLLPAPGPSTPASLARIRGVGRSAGKGVGRGAGVHRPPSCPASLLLASINAAVEACASEALSGSDAFHLVWAVHRAGLSLAPPQLLSLSTALHRGYQSGRLDGHEVARALLALGVAWEQAEAVPHGQGRSIAQSQEALGGEVAALTPDQRPQSWTSVPSVDAAVNASEKGVIASALSAVWQPKLSPLHAPAGASTSSAASTTSPTHSDAALSAFTPSHTSTLDQLPTVPDLALCLAALPHPRSDPVLQSMTADELSMVMLTLRRLRLQLSADWLTEFGDLLQHNSDNRAPQQLFQLSKEGLQRVLLAFLQPPPLPSASPPHTPSTFPTHPSGLGPLSIPYESFGVDTSSLEPLLTWVGSQVDRCCALGTVEGVRATAPTVKGAGSSLSHRRPRAPQQQQQQPWQVPTPEEGLRLRCLLQLARAAQEQRRQQHQAAMQAAAAAQHVQAPAAVLAPSAVAAGAGKESVSVPVASEGVVVGASNNVVDAAQLLQRVHRQLQQQQQSSRVQQAWQQQQGQEQAQQSLHLQSVGWQSEHDQQQQPEEAELVSPQQPGSSMAQALCLRLLSLKFRKMVSFALKINVMRSAYSTCLARRDFDPSHNRPQLVAASTRSRPARRQGSGGDATWVLQGK